MIMSKQYLGESQKMTDEVRCLQSSLTIKSRCSKQTSQVNLKGQPELMSSHETDSKSMRDTPITLMIGEKSGVHRRDYCRMSIQDAAMTPQVRVLCLFASHDFYIVKHEN